MDKKANTGTEIPISKSANPEFSRFTEAMQRIVQVPYLEIKKRLEAENKVRSRKRTHKSKIAAFRAANGKG
jgi:hypothetical protein